MKIDKAIDLCTNEAKKRGLSTGWLASIIGATEFSLLSKFMETDWKARKDTWFHLGGKRSSADTDYRYFAQVMKKGQPGKSNGLYIVISGSYSSIRPG